MNPTVSDRGFDSRSSFEARFDAAQFADDDLTTAERLADAPAATVTLAQATPDEATRLAVAGDVDGAVERMIDHPEEIDAVIEAFGAHRPGLVPALLEAGGEVVASHLADQLAAEADPSFGTRVWGGLRAVGGGIEAVVGGALVLAPEPTGLSIAGGGILAVHGADNFQAGLRQAWTGRPVDSFTQQAGEGVALALGADPATAEWIGVGVDVGVGLAGSGLAALSRISARSATVWASVTPTQGVHAGTVIPRSFELSAGTSRVWVAGNATKHMADDALAHLNRGVDPALVNVGSQVQMSSLQAAVRAATANGVPYDDLVRVGGWELVFRPAREAGQLPALVHALPIR